MLVLMEDVHCTTTRYGLPGVQRLQILFFFSANAFCFGVSAARPHLLSYFGMATTENMYLTSGLKAEASAEYPDAPDQDVPDHANVLRIRCVGFLSCIANNIVPSAC